MISLDCEGKWGMADSLSPRYERELTTAKLVAAYRRLVSLFAQYDVCASFAFVTAFILDDAQRSCFAADFERAQADHPSWMARYAAAKKNSQMEGWSCPESLELVLRDGRHEIASHGFCHVPLGNDAETKKAQRELASVRSIGSRIGLDFASFVYPRNLVGDVSLLAEAGFKHYREAPPASGGRLGNLVREFNIRTPARAASSRKEPITAIPSGYFLNWRQGVRALVPAQLSRMRWRHILKDARRSGRPAGVFLHPHNIITAPPTFDLLEYIVDQAARMRDRGELEIITFAQYCRQRNSADDGT